MNKFFRYFSLVVFLILSSVLLNGCQSGKVMKPFKHNTPLIKEAKSGDQKSIERLKEIISVSYLHELTTDEIASEAN